MPLSGALLPFLSPELLTRLYATNILQNERVNTSRFTLELFSTSPLIGLGYNAQAAKFASTYGLGAEGFSLYSNAASTPFQILSDSGILGFAFFAAFAWCLLWACLHVARAPSPRPDADAEKIHQTVRGAACWLLVFVPFNQSAAYLLPNSLLGALLFAMAGLVVGYRSQLMPNST